MTKFRVVESGVWSELIVNFLFFFSCSPDRFVPRGGEKLNPVKKWAVESLWKCLNRERERRERGTEKKNKKSGGDFIEAFQEF